MDRQTGRPPGHPGPPNRPGRPRRPEASSYSRSVAGPVPRRPDRPSARPQNAARPGPARPSGPPPRHAGRPPLHTPPSPHMTAPLRHPVPPPYTAGPLHTTGPLRTFAPNDAVGFGNWGHTASGAQVTNGTLPGRPAPIGIGKGRPAPRHTVRNDGKSVGFGARNAPKPKSGGLSALFSRSKTVKRPKTPEFPVDSYEEPMDVYYGDDMGYEPPVRMTADDILREREAPAGISMSKNTSELPRSQREVPSSKGSTEAIKEKAVKQPKFPKIKAEKPVYEPILNSRNEYPVHEPELILPREPLREETVKEPKLLKEKPIKEKAVKLPKEKPVKEEAVKLPKEKPVKEKAVKQPKLLKEKPVKAKSAKEPGAPAGISASKNTSELPRSQRGATASKGNTGEVNKKGERGAPAGIS
ncbi:MAG: hypothetical protein LBR54_00580, partial [Oscillospiraceae bacterium]|nr:hypothetical protein [Oscillospiraceae bacterium]